MRPAHALAMFWWCEAAERRHILLRFSAERTLLLDMCSDIFRYAASEGYSDPVVRKTLQVIERRQRNRAALDQVAARKPRGRDPGRRRQGHGPANRSTEISHLSGIKPSTGERIFQDPGGEGIAVLCKATGLKRQFLRELWTALRPRPAERRPGLPARVGESTKSIAVAKAQTVLRYWNWSLSSAYSPDADRGRWTTTRTLGRELRMIDDATLPKAAFGASFRH